MTTGEKSISLIIPNYNGSATIGKCLEAAFASRYGNFEVIVVDDHSSDNSVEIIQRYPCTLIRLDKRSGAGAARNTGARNSNGDVLFFTDADCLVREDALARANEAVAGHPGAVIGGTYTPLPFDPDFFSAFQSLFIHYSESRKPEPDYIAAHAMVIDAGLFRASGGFPEEFLPIIEDVELSHRLRRSGLRLLMAPEIQVRHIFRFSLLRSLGNAFRKSKYWTMYSLANRDLLADSGTASRELKLDAASFFASALFCMLFLTSGAHAFLIPASIVYAANLFVSRNLLALFLRAKGLRFAVTAALYYTLVYPLAVGAGVCAGVLKHLVSRRKKG